MNLYFLGILAALVVFFAVGIGAGRMVKDTNDYYVSGRNAPTLLIDLLCLRVAAVHERI